MLLDHRVSASRIHLENSIIEGVCRSCYNCLPVDRPRLYSRLTQAKFSLGARNRRVFFCRWSRKPWSCWWVWIESPVTEAGECVVASVFTHEHGSRRRGGTGWVKNSFARGRGGYVPSAAAAELSGRGGVTRTGAVPKQRAITGNNQPNRTLVFTPRL